MDLQSLHTMVQNTSNDGDYLQQALNSKLPTVLAGCRDISEIEPCITDALEIASPEVKESIFTGGIALLLAFVQNAFTGPSLALSGTDILHEDFDRESAQKSSLQMLETDGELAYSLTPEPFLLYVASVILVVNRANFAKFKTGPWWAYRCAFVHQKILDNFSDSLSHIITESLDACSQGLLGVEGDRELHIRILMEKGLVHHYYTRDTEAKSWFIKAQECSKLKWSLTGALGKRTKHQTFEVSQLVVIAESHVDSPEDTKGSAATPSQLDLNCDTLLEKIEFSKLDDGSIPDAPSKLNVTDQCILLAFCLHLKNTNPEDGLTTEQMLPYVQRVLQNPNNWMVYTMALLIKSRLESHKSRTVERSVLQLQALVDQFEVQECSVGEKMDHFFTIELPPKWDLEKELGHRLMSIGVVRSAMEIFERLEHWEDVISCYQMLDEPKKAEQLIRRLLIETPKSAKLHCLLGDVTSDPEQYQKAWDLSGGRFSRAMRSLGAEHYRKQEWQASIDCYSKALLINPLFDNSWFIMGCAALQLELFDQAIIAFGRVTSIDPEQKRLVEALRCLREALKSNYDASNIWENYLFVSIDLKEFQESIKAMGRVFSIRIEKDDLKSTAVDNEVLDILVSAISENIPDSQGTPSSKYAQNIVKLLELITSRFSSAHVFIICAKFYQSQGSYRKSLDYAQKAHRFVLNEQGLDTNSSIFNQLVHVTLGVVDAYKCLGDMLEPARMGYEPEPVCKDWKYQSKMAIKASLSRTKMVYETLAGYDTLNEKLQELKSE